MPTDTVSDPTRLVAALLVTQDGAIYYRCTDCGAEGVLVRVGVLASVVDSVRRSHTKREGVCYHAPDPKTGEWLACGLEVDADVCPVCAERPRTVAKHEVRRCARA